MRFAMVLSVCLSLSLMCCLWCVSVCLSCALGKMVADVVRPPPNPSEKSEKDFEHSPDDAGKILIYE